MGGGGGVRGLLGAAGCLLEGGSERQAGRCPRGCRWIGEDRRGWTPECGGRACGAIGCPSAGRMVGALGGDGSAAASWLALPAASGSGGVMLVDLAARSRR